MKKEKIKKIYKKVKKEGKKKNMFRLQGKHLFLTYPKIEITREEALEQLKEKILPRRIEKYVISTEKHTTGEEHVHVYLELDKKSNIENKNRLDLEIEGKEGKEKKHGNYQSCRSYNNVVNYIIKEGKTKVLTNKDLDDLGRDINIWKKLYESNKDDDIKETLNKIGEIAPKLMITDYPRVKKALIEMKNDNKVKGDIIYAEGSFKVPKKVKDFMEKPEKTLYLSGGSGIGKTEMMKMLFAKKYGKDNFLRINNIEGIKALMMKSYKGLILDDVDLKKLTPEEILGLLDVQNTHNQRVLYGTVDVPAGMARAVVTNKKINELGADLPIRQLEALLRRCINIDLGNKRVILTLKMEIEEKEEKEENKEKEEKEEEDWLTKRVEEGVQELEEEEEFMEEKEEEEGFTEEMEEEEEEEMCEIRRKIEED